MAVNRFNTPIVTPHEQTYVSQFIPMPFDMIQKGADRLQAKEDKIKAIGTDMLENMGEQLHTVDTPRQKELIQGYYDQVNSELEAAGGDWTKLDNSIRKIGQDYRQRVTSGEFGVGSKSYAQYQDNLKAAEKTKVPRYEVELGLNKIIQDYARPDEQGNVGMLKGQPLQQLPLYKFEDLNNTLLDAVNTLKASGYGKVTTKISEDGDMKISTGSESEGVTHDEILSLARDNIYNKPAFEDKVKYLYWAEGHQDQTEGMSDDDKKAHYANFKDYQWDNLIGKNKYKSVEWNKSNKKYEESLTAAGDDKAKKIADIVDMQATTQTPFVARPAYLDVIKSSQPFKEYASKFAISKQIAFKGQLSKMAGDNDPAQGSAKYKQAMRTFGNKTNKFTVNETGAIDPLHEFAFIRAIAQGDPLAMDALVTSGVYIPSANNNLADDIKEQAETVMTEWENQEMLFADITTSLEKEGKMSSAEAKAYRQHITNIFDNDKPLKDIDMQELVTFGVGGDTYNFSNPAFNNTSNVMKALAGGRQQSAFNIFYSESIANDTLKNRLKNAQSTTLTITTKSMLDVINPTTGEIDPAASKTLTADIDKSIKSQPNVLKNSTIVRLDENNTVQQTTLFQALLAEAKVIEKNGEAGDKSVNEIAEEKFQELLKNQITYATSAGSFNKDMVIGLGGYFLELGRDAGQFQINKIKKTVAPKSWALMQVNSMVTRSMIDPNGDTKIDRGIYINTDAPGGGDLPKDYSVSGYAVKIKPSQLGLSGTGEVRLGQNEGRELLESIAVLDMVYQNTGSWNFKGVKYTSRKEAAKAIAAPYIR